MCTAIRDGQAIDVVEMDAASETGIDDVREKIIENARYAPVEARYKVYIIDEVHDLSQKAFDSLLKTIEEPPSHVVFVLATTEAHKVPVTIRSRCQRMDFRRGSLVDLHANLRRVVEAEKVDYDPEALFLIARAAEGSFRDSLSLLEQVLALADTRITPDTVRQAIGAVTTDTLESVIRAVHDHDMKGVLDAASRIVASGTDVRQTLVALQEHIRDLLVVALSGTPDALGGAPPERTETLVEQSRWFEPNRFVAMLQVLAEAERDLRFTNQHRLVLERALCRLVTLEDVISTRTDAAPRTRATRPARDESAAEAAVPTNTSHEPPQVAEPPASVSSRGDDVTLDVLRRLWPRVTERVFQKSNSARSVLTPEVKVAELCGTTMVLEFPSSFLRERADRPASRRLIEEALAQELRLGGYTVRCTVRGSSDSQDRAVTETSRDGTTSDGPRTLLDEAAEALDGEVVESNES